MFLVGLRRQGGNSYRLLLASSRSLSSKPPPSAVPPVNGEETPATKAKVASNKAKTSTANAAGKSDGESKDTEASPAATPRKRLSKKKLQQQQQPITVSSKYISFDDFPKLPKEIRNASDGLLNQVRLNRKFYPSGNDPEAESTGTGSGSVSVSAVESPKLESKNIPYHDFSIPSQHLRGYHPQVMEADRLLNELNDFSAVFEFSELNQPPHAEHPLKRSWSKMIPINPGLHSISNEYLWELAPQGKIFQSPPFDSHTYTIDGFKDWEEKMKYKAKVEFEKDFNEQAETNQAIKEFNKNKSFISSTTGGGRKKLNRKLVKTFKKLKNEGKLGKKDENDD